MRVLFLLVLGTFVSGQNLIDDSRARVQDPVEYYTELMQDVILEVEKRCFCNLEVNDVVVQHDEELYNFHVAGNATYTNGFVVSIEKIDVTNIEQRVSRSTFNEETVPTAMVRGRLNLRDVTIGRDVIAEINGETKHYSGIYTHTLIQFELTVLKNLVSGEIQTFSTMLSLSSGTSVRMTYLPADNITEALSRRFTSSMSGSGAANWGTIFTSIMLEKATTKIAFPRVCFNC